MEFALFLNYAMDKTGMTNYRLAKEVEVSQTSVANWRSGERVPRKGPKEKVLKLFGVTEGDIKGDDFPEIHFTGEEQKESPPHGGEPLDPVTRELIEFVETASDDERRAALEMVKLIKKQRGEQNG